MDAPDFTADLIPEPQHEPTIIAHAPHEPVVSDEEPDFCKDLVDLNLGDVESPSEPDIIEDEIYSIQLFPESKKELTLVYNKTEETFHAQLKSQVSLPVVSSANKILTQEQIQLQELKLEQISRRNFHVILNFPE